MTDIADQNGDGSVTLEDGKFRVCSHFASSFITLLCFLASSDTARPSGVFDEDRQPCIGHVLLSYHRCYGNHCHLPYCQLLLASCRLLLTTYYLLAYCFLLSIYYLLPRPLSSLIVAVDFIAILNLSSHSASNREA